MLLGRSVRPPLLLEEGAIMTDVVNMRRESIDLEALLLSRAYLYMLFHKLFGGTPDAAMVACVLSETTRDVVEEYAGDDPSMKGLGRFLEEPRRVRRWRGADRAGPRRVHAPVHRSG